MPQKENRFENSNTHYVAEMFDDMAEEYDNLKDCWYRHTFGFIDELLLKYFHAAERPDVPQRALDVGCGTGIQSVRLASQGYQVEGIDISSGLVEAAIRKAEKLGLQHCNFRVADGREIPFAGSTFDVVNCCGPTLSFIPEWEIALGEMTRCLKPGGKILLEVEGKWTPDLFWEVISSLLFDVFGYGGNLSTALSHFKGPLNTGPSISYSFKRESGETVSMPLKTFTPAELLGTLEKLGIHCDNRWALHSITNIIPSPLLHDANPSRLVRALFQLLAPIDRMVANYPFFRSFGCSLVVIGTKTPASDE